MIKEIFGDYLWISKMDPEFIEEYKKLFETSNHTINTNSWSDCNVKSSFFNKELIKNKSSIDYNGMFSKRLNSEMENFISELENYGEDKVTIDLKYKIQNIWYNKYNMGDFQEIHCHTGRDSFYSFIYQYKTTNKKLDSRVVFVNPRSSFFKGNMYNEIIKKENYKSDYRPCLSDGELIIFPSHMKHFVSVHKNSDNDRISISGNINLINNIDF
jgi:hypothetical protein